MRVTIVLLLALAAALACAHGDEVEVGEDSVRVPPEVVTESADRAEDRLDRESTVRLIGPDGEILGSADLSGDDDAWRVEIEIDPPQGAAGWRAFVVRGDCDGPRGRVVQLDPFAADDDGFESVTRVPRAWLKAGTSYAVRVLDGEGGVAACGEIGEI